MNESFPDQLVSFLTDFKNASSQEKCYRHILLPSLLYCTNMKDDFQFISVAVLIKSIKTMIPLSSLMMPLNSAQQFRYGPLLFKVLYHDLQCFLLNQSPPTKPFILNCTNTFPSIFFIHVLPQQSSYILLVSLQRIGTGFFQILCVKGSSSFTLKYYLFPFEPNQSQMS